jgi:Ca2+-binding RTX toxin-like protein
MAKSYRDNPTDLSFLADAVAAARARPVVLRFDESVAFERYQLFGTADRIVLGTGHDEAVPVDHIYFFELNNGEFSFNTPQLVIDARELSGVFAPEQNLFGEIVYVGTQTVTAYSVKFLGGGSSDRFASGIGSDTLHLAGGDDYASIGTGDDTVFGGAGDDYVDSTAGGFNARDTFHGGAGLDQLTFYNQNLADADFANIRSVEVLGPSGPSNVELDRLAQRAGIQTLFVDSYNVHEITVGAGFTGPLTINHLGAVGPVMMLDASESSATITLYAGYDSTAGSPTYAGGTGGADTIYISNGFIYPGSPPHGGNLSNVTGFEHVVVEDLGGDSGAYLMLDTAEAEIAAAFQSIDASGLGATKPFELFAGKASADLHVTAGAGADMLRGGTGDDWLDGGAGADLMNGRGGRDVFLYDAVSDSSGDAVDEIRAFSRADTIDVTGLTDPALAGQAIAFFGNQASGGGADGAFADTAGNGMLDAVFRTDTQLLWFDTDDNGLLEAGDLHMMLTGVTGLRGADVLAGEVIG